MDITEKLLGWYSANKRTLPWRGESDPFRIWLSEIILQQTRVEQGLPYYLRFISTFPGVSDLARASESQVLRLWQGLGYYSRARNLHKTAKQIMEHHNGNFPTTFQQLIKLPGIGDYTAAAIASIAFNQPVPAVDGNIKRIISRILNLEENIQSAKTYKRIKDTCKEMMAQHDPGTFNQALMDLGALQCTPKNPKCPLCPVQDHCLAYSENTVNERPVKYKKQKKTVRYFNYLVIESVKNGNTHIYIEQRKQKDIWTHLYQFPLCESTELWDKKSLIHQLKRFLPEQDNLIVSSISRPYKHLLSHQTIHARFFRVQILESVPVSANTSWVSIPRENISDYAIPRLIEQYLEESD